MELVKQLLIKGSWVSFGAGSLWLANNVFDWVIYPLVMCNMGNVIGAIIMALASIPFNYLLIRGYDLIGQDMLGIETLKEFQESTDGEGVIRKWLRQTLSKGRFGTFVFISLYDPIPATLFMREGTRTFHGLKRKDWLWFAISTIIANVMWIVLIATGIESAEAIIGVCT